LTARWRLAMDELRSVDRKDVEAMVGAGLAIVVAIGLGLGLGLTIGHTFHPHAGHEAARAARTSVPDVVGLTSSEARTRLLRADLHSRTTPAPMGDDHLVLWQDPPPRSTVETGSFVLLEVRCSKAPCS